MKAIILAAGRGSRLGKITESIPKCLLTIGSKAILDYQLGALSAAGITNVALVLGFKSEAIKKHLAAYANFNFTFIHNPDYETTNTAYSLWLARHEMSGAFMYLNGDVLGHPDIIKRLSSAPARDALAVVRKKTGDEEVKVILQGARVTSIGKKISSAEAYGEFTGIAKFSGAIAPAFVSALEEVLKTAEGRTDYFEAALERIAPATKMTAIDITDLPCIEIDFPADLSEARLHVLPELLDAGGSRKPKILFYAERNLHLPFLEPIHDYMAEHFQAELAFSSPPHVIAQGPLLGHGLSKQEVDRLKTKCTFYERPEDFQADVAVVADACFYPVRHCKKVADVGHGLISKGWFYTDKPPVRRENLADLICVPGRWHKEMLQKNIFSSLIVTGFIKTDALYACDDAEKGRFYKKYTISQGKKIILFAPTFNEELSALPCVAARISEVADDSAVLLIKLHGMTDKKWICLYRTLEAEEKNIRVIDDKDFMAAMACADVMISDVSSAAVEFMLLDKPAVLFNNPRRKEYAFYDPDNIEYTVRDAAIQVGSVEEMKLAVKLSLVNPGEYSAKRKAYAGLLNHAIDGKCAQRASEAVMELIQGSAQTSVRENDLFSIIVQGERNFSDAEIRLTLQDIKNKCSGMQYEIIVIGHRSPEALHAHSEVKAWIESCSSADDALKQAFAHAGGKYVVLLKQGITLPYAWLKWMYYHFRFHADAGAVKAFSYRDNYREILKQVPAASHLHELPDIADFFVFLLMGNDVPADAIEKAHECIMVSRQAYDAAGGFSSVGRALDPVYELCLRIKKQGYTLWNASEVLAYPLKFSEQCAEAPADNFTKLNKAAYALRNAPAIHADAARFDPQHEKRLSEMSYPEAPYAAPGKAFGAFTASQARCAADILSRARACKKEKKYSDAILLLEKAKADFILASKKEELPRRGFAEKLLADGRLLKEKKEYAASIRILEEAKRNIA